MIYKIWYAITQKLAAWLEWQDAKAWAEDFRPGMLEISKRAKSKAVRKLYRDKILKAYRGDVDV